MRLHLLKQQAQAGDIVLLFADESEALTHPYLAHAWAQRVADLRIKAPGQARKVAMIGALDCAQFWSEFPPPPTRTFELGGMPPPAKLLI